MSRFTEPLVVSPLEDGKRWVIYMSATEDDPTGERRFAYELGEEGSGDIILPPVQFVTDFASIPRLLWWWLPVWGRYGNAAVIHDYLYQRGVILYDEAIRVYPTRQEADEIFLEGMTVLETPWYQKWPIYWGVRLGGWWPWRKVRK